jgi:LPS export ABC transporter protein LptC
MAITMDARGPGGGAGAPVRGVPSLTERGRSFRQAQRHTLRVKVLRVALPVGAAAIAALYGLVLASSWQLGRGRLSVGEVQVTADDLTMKNPKYFGVTKDGGRYEVRAKQAIVTFNQQAPIKLIGIDGDLVQPDNVVTRLSAKHGLLDNAKGQLELYDGIEIDASNGLKARLSRATVYSKEHRIVSRQPVDVTTPTGRVQGSAMTLRTNTREAAFVGNVAVRLVPSGSAGSTTAALGRDSRQPVDVTAEQLHVNDALRTAIFTGDVVAVQDDAMLKTPELHVFYEGRPASELATAAPGRDGQGSRLSRLIGKNGAVVTAGSDRRVSCDQVEFDAKANTALFTGNVLVNQQKNVLQGRLLFIDRKRGRSRLEAPREPGQPPGRIAATFYQSARAPVARPKTGVGAADNQQGVFSSFKADPNAPMDVEADTLDVLEATRSAVFRGNVKAQQGEFVVRTVEMVAHYSGQIGLAAADTPEEGAGSAPAQITRVEARQKVLITSRDGQTATGDWATFDMKANTVLMGDHVVVSRGKDVAEGPRLKIDLTTGMYRFELESEAASKPATSASPPLTGPTPPTDPAARSCPPGKQCLLVYPKEIQERAKAAVKKLLPGAEASKPNEGWQPSTSASPVLRSD